MYFVAYYFAGYEEELKTCFFAYNSGLDSRFTWRFKTDSKHLPVLNENIYHDDKTIEVIIFYVKK